MNNIWCIFYKSASSIWIEELQAELKIKEDYIKELENKLKERN